MVSLEARRRAVADALRTVAEPARAVDAASVASHLRRLEERVARLTYDVQRVLARLDELEGALVGEADEEADDGPPPPPVPPFRRAARSMSPAASQALFGD